MATSETSICNLALANLGQQAIISISDQTAVGAYCRDHYYQCRDSLIQAYRWNFAIKRETLSLLTEVPLAEWSYFYQMPSDCLRALEINGYDWGWYGCQNLFAREQDKIATNATEVVLKYLFQVTDTNQFPPLFTEALAVSMAMKLAVPLKGSQDIKQGLMVEYQRLTGPVAREANAFEGKPRIPLAYERSPLVASRGFGFGEYGVGGWWRW